MTLSTGLPAHPVLTPRLEAIQRALIAGFDGGIECSSATKGAERELFVGGLLRQVFPPTFRFGTGDITDYCAERSGQVDIVIEFPHIFSLPLAPDGPRLYMAESVAAVVEVKSNVAKQWDDVSKSVQKVKALKRRYYQHYLKEQAESYDAKAQAFAIHGESASKVIEMNRRLATEHREELARLPISVPDQIPFFAVGFDGWKDVACIRDASNAAHVTGVLVVREMLYVSEHYTVHGPESLLVFLDHIYEELNTQVETLPAYKNYVFKYTDDVLFPH